MYADSSALVKLVVREPETEALRDHLTTDMPRVATSSLAVVEVTRAVGLAAPGEEAQLTADELLGRCLLVSVTLPLLPRARALTSAQIRTLDAIHLASALRVEPDELVAYDRRLIEAARALGLTVVSPGA